MKAVMRVEMTTTKSAYKKMMSKKRVWRKKRIRMNHRYVPYYRKRYGS